MAFQSGARHRRKQERKEQPEKKGKGEEALTRRVCETVRGKGMRVGAH